MCGRYTITNPENIYAEYGVMDDSLVVPRFNVSPNQDVPVIMAGLASRKFENLKWGLLPRWAKDTHQIIINARDDGVATKHTFRDSFRKRRCLVLADGYYEWKRDGSERRPFYFRLKEGRLFGFAGIFAEYRYSEGTVVRGCAIITTMPNDLAAEVHNRMPVVLLKEDEARWLETPENKAVSLTDLLAPYPADRMELWEVGKKVSTPAINNPQLVVQLDRAALSGSEIDSA